MPVEVGRIDLKEECREGKIREKRKLKEDMGGRRSVRRKEKERVSTE
jgi:hypothetical protein